MSRSSVRLSTLALITALAIGGRARAQDGAERPATVRVGVLAIRGAAHARGAWTATAEYLSEQIPDRRFEIVPFTDLEAAGPAIASRSIEFLIVQPAEYVAFERDHGLSRMLTMRNRTPRGPQTRFGGVIFVRADSPIQTIEDIRGHSVMAVGERAFGAWLMQKREMMAHGLDVPGDFSRLEFRGLPQDPIVLAVRDGSADVGIVRTDLLERMAAAGTIRMEEFRVLNPQSFPGFPFLTSTRLYPEWAFAVAPHTDQALSQRVAVALLGMPGDHPAARAAANVGWTVPLDYGPVHEILRELRAPPYDRVPEITIGEMIAQHWHIVALGVLSLLLMGGVTLFVLRLNRNLSDANSALAREIDTRKKMEHQLLISEKMASLGQMAAGIAHEINSPLGYVYSNVSLLQRAMPALIELLHAYRRIESKLAPEDRAEVEELRERIHLDDLEEDMPQMFGENVEGLQRIRAIVKDIRNFSHVGEQDWQTVDLRETIQSTLNMARKAIEEKDGTLVAELGEIPPIECIAAQIAQVVLNLVSNAKDAIAKGGQVAVRAKSLDADHIVIEVEDDGAGMTEEVARRIFDPFFTTKPVGSGTGLGLAISMRIVKAHDGRIEVKTQPGKGSTFRLVLPTRAASMNAAARSPNRSNHPSARPPPVT